MLDGTEYFECSCGSDEHTIRFVLDKKDKEIYLCVFLNQYRPWWKRIWIALKYVFGYKCKYGHWDNWTMVSTDVERLQKMCSDFIKEK